MLPSDVKRRPTVSIPVVGLSVNYDDISILAALLLFAGLIWFRFSISQVSRAIRRHLEQLGPEADSERAILLSEFAFLGETRRGEIRPTPGAFLLFFIAYLATMLSLAQDLYEMVWQIIMYSKLTNTPWVPLVGPGGSLWASQVAGISFLRLGVLSILAVLLAGESWTAWAIMEQIARVVSGRTRVPSGSKDGQVWQIGFALLSASPIYLIIALSIGRWATLFAPRTDESHGWLYGPSLLGALLVIAAIVLALLGWSWWARPYLLRRWRNVE